MSTQNIMYKVSVPYAEALLELVKDKNLLLRANSDLSLISTMLSDSIDLQSTLSNPLINTATKKNIIERLCKDMIDDCILKFLFVLIDRRRISLLNIIIEKYFELAYTLESTVVVKLATPIAFSEIQQNAIINKIKIMTKSQQVKLIINIDTSLIGGFVIMIGSKVIDTSLAGKLKQIFFYLNQA